MENPTTSIIPHIFLVVKGLTKNKMKICAIICEYNPFHNGHAYHIEIAKGLSGADAVLCLMSGNFVQRGEAAILDKFTRAKHALLCGADAVIELPTVFATSNAELFAKGAVALLSAIPEVTHLCFGAEHADKEEFLSLARLLNDEPKELSTAIKELTATGMSYAKAYATACERFTGGKSATSPNDILGLEYAKAILKTNANIELLPIPRQGSGYNERGLTGEFASATAIREHVKTGEVQATYPYLPEVVYEDLKLADTTNRLSMMERTAILIKSKEDLRKILDCTEGLENAFKGAAEKTDEFVKELTSARYTAARLRRIALHNVLNIEESFIRNCLSSPLYLTPLAYKKERTDLLSALSKASIPFLSSGKQIKALFGVAKRCYEKDEFASTVYDAITNTKTSKELVIV